MATPALTSAAATISSCISALVARDETRTQKRTLRARSARDGVSRVGSAGGPRRGARTLAHDFVSRAFTVQELHWQHQRASSRYVGGPNSGQKLGCAALLTYHRGTVRYGPDFHSSRKYSHQCQGRCSTRSAASRSRSSCRPVRRVTLPRGGPTWATRRRGPARARLFLKLPAAGTAAPRPSCRARRPAVARVRRGPLTNEQAHAMVAPARAVEAVEDWLRAPRGVSPRAARRTATSSPRPSPCARPRRSSARTTARTRTRPRTRARCAASRSRSRRRSRTCRDRRSDHALPAAPAAAPIAERNWCRAPGCSTTRRRCARSTRSTTRRRRRAREPPGGDRVPRADVLGGRGGVLPREPLPGGRRRRSRSSATRRRARRRGSRRCSTRSTCPRWARSTRPSSGVRVAPVDAMDEPPAWLYAVGNASDAPCRSSSRRATARTRPPSCRAATPSASTPSF